jgi:hypothetical protein
LRKKSAETIRVLAEAEKNISSATDEVVHKKRRVKKPAFFSSQKPKLIFSLLL